MSDLYNFMHLIDAGIHLFLFGQNFPEEIEYHLIRYRWRRLQVFLFLHRVHLQWSRTWAVYALIDTIGPQIDPRDSIEVTITLATAYGRSPPLFAERTADTEAFACCRRILYIIAFCLVTCGVYRL